MSYTKRSSFWMWVIANVLRKHQLPVKAHAHPDRGKQTVSALPDPHTHRTCIRTARKGSYRIRNVVSSAGVICFFDCTHHRWRTTTGPARRRAQRERAVPHVVRRSHERTPLLQCPSARDLHRLLVRSDRTAHSTPSIPSTPSAPGDHPRRSSARKGSSSTFRGHRPRRRPTRGTRTSSAPRGHCRHSSSHSRPWQPSPCAVR